MANQIVLDYFSLTQCRHKKLMALTYTLKIQVYGVRTNFWWLVLYFQS